MTPRDYNAKQMAAGMVTAEHVTELTTIAQRDLGLEVDGKLGPQTRAALERRYTPTPVAPMPTPILHDIRASAKTSKIVKGETKQLVGGRRPWLKTTGICLHQTACVLGERPARWETCGAHIGITQSGAIIWIRDLDRVAYHGNGWNAQTVGIEIDGLFAGVEGDPKTVWDDPSTQHREAASKLQPAQISSAQWVIRWIVSEVARHGGQVRALVAHRQSSSTRRNDPGSAIWQAVALPMIAELGLSDGGPGYKIGTGYAIPEAWDPARKGVRY
jgi:hypothetical protein